MGERFKPWSMKFYIPSQICHWLVSVWFLITYEVNLRLTIVPERHQRALVIVTGGNTKRRGYSRLLEFWTLHFSAPLFPMAHQSKICVCNFCQISSQLVFSSGSALKTASSVLKFIAEITKRKRNQRGIKKSQNNSFSVSHLKVCWNLREHCVQL